jgi:porin
VNPAGPASPHPRSRAEWSQKTRGALASVAAACVGIGSAAAATDAPTNAPANTLLLSDRFGNATRVATNEVSPSLHPPAAVGLPQQIPTAPKGTPQSDEVRQRILASQTGRQWFPPTPPVLMPYLANLDEYGNTAIQPGAVFATDPLSQGAQAGKYALSSAGLRYSFYQSLTLVSMTDVASGASALQYYTATFFGKWAVTEVTDAGRSGWLSTEVNVQQGLSPVSRTQSPQGNLGTVVNPQATVFGPNGIWLSELAWQQSLLDGQLVLLAGQVDQSNYLDANTYANNSQGQFLNSAFVNSQVLPFSFNNLGFNLQYQPSKFWYVMLGAGANNQAPGQTPFDNLGFHNWSYLVELGLTPKNVLGLGPGAYRLQPFVATVSGATQTGVGLNLQQQLGTNSPFAWFGRFGVGGNQVTLGGAAAQAATGLVMQAPLQHAGLFPRLSNDYLGAGFVWSRPSAVMQPVAHANEYGFEALYVLQLTPLASLQPDLQVVWNPANNPNAEHAVVFQLQLNLTW